MTDHEGAPKIEATTPAEEAQAASVVDGLKAAVPTELATRSLNTVPQAAGFARADTGRIGAFCIYC